MALSVRTEDRDAMKRTPCRATRGVASAESRQSAAAARANVCFMLRCNDGGRTTVGVREACDIRNAEDGMVLRNPFITYIYIYYAHPTPLS